GGGILLNQTSNGFTATYGDACQSYASDAALASLRAGLSNLICPEGVDGRPDYAGLNRKRVLARPETALPQQPTPVAAGSIRPSVGRSLIGVPASRRRSLRSAKFLCKARHLNRHLCP